ncbi:MAG: hypothetical protein ACXQS7_05715, partial [Candidatus Syntropharchaeia archaeon]
MRVALVEFRLESYSMYLREFYASRMGSLMYFSKEAVANAISYSDMFKRDRKEEWKEIEFPFKNTPAVPIDVRVDEIVYKAGDDPNRGLLRYGKQEVILPGSIFKTALWGEYPRIERGQVFFIGKKRGTAVITKLSEYERELEEKYIGKIFPIQVSPVDLNKFDKYRPLIATSRFFIIQPYSGKDLRWLNVDDHSIP